MAAVGITNTDIQQAVSDLSGVVAVTASLGAAQSKRIICVVVHVESDDSPGGVEIDGVSCPLVAFITNNAASPDNHVYIYAGEFPSGTSATITATTGTSDGETWTFGVFRVVDAVFSPLSDSSTNTGSGTSIDLTGLTIPTNGGAIVGWTNASNTACTWTNATESYDSTGGVAYRASAAIITAAGTPTINADGATGQQCIAGIAFDPAPDTKRHQPIVVSQAVHRASRW